MAQDLQTTAMTADTPVEKVYTLADYQREQKDDLLARWVMRLQIVVALSAIIYYWSTMVRKK